MEIKSNCEILFLTGNFKSLQGYYYEDWEKELSRLRKIKVVKINYLFDIFKLNNESLKSIKTLIIGHHSWNLTIDSWFSKFHILKPVKNFIRNILCKILRNFFVNNIKIIVFSKNDYKDIKVKSQVCKSLKANLIITHTKNALIEFKKNTDIKCWWIPFGYSEEKFWNNKSERVFDIGFRGNINSFYNDSERSILIEKLSSFKSIKTDIKPSINGENFLYGDKYRRWMQSCTLILNSRSANDTVGPKWWEQMACGSVPIAFEGEYEGLLKPNINYIPLSKNQKITEKLVFEILQNRKLIEDIKSNNLKYVNSFRVSNQASNLLNRWDDFHTILNS